MKTLRVTFTLIAIHLTGLACTQPAQRTGDAADEKSIADPVQLTHGFARAGEAYFSHDSKWIIFQASVKPNSDFEMYVAPTKWDGERITGIGAPVRISPAGSWNSCGYFSPDGKFLIFSSTQKPLEKKPEPAHKSYHWNMPATAEIFRADGWRQAVAAVPAGGSVDLAKHAITHNHGYDAECGLSPDGKWIIYCSNTTGDPEIWAMRSDGSKQVQLTHNPGYDGGPFFSPDGKRICYRSDRKGNSLLQIYVADLKFDEHGDIVGKANETRLTDNQAVNFGPFWYPDGRHLIWGTSLQGQRNFELYLMRSDGSGQVRITDHPGADLLPVFSSDGKWLMWTSQRGADKTSQIWVARFTLPKE